ncbi:hypothetical protein ES319_A11G049600v1 [Gossypium barbadense]|uniref:ZF-HD dimerization-type domain-containing protein n=2 Tax=Gossypium TaxID=3633 RepID=A0A5J5TI85_GOSBA|nr:hypothetical protein ES319_A11G049600v1 [Gossypium barbadense]TYG92681.1 hypothetical protein ES288_A11G051700v1 [Gossypium darwinii]
MEVKGQDKQMGMPSSFSRNNKLNQADSSLKISSSSAPINQSRTLDQYNESNPSQHQIDNPRSNPDHDRNPVSAPIPTVAAPTSTTISSTPLIRYRECLKNHVASMGGHVVDGCGEFMPSGEDSTQEALKCAACECHRNFHRKEIDGETQYPATRCCFTYKNNERRGPVHPQQPTPLRQQRFSLGFSNSPCLPIAPAAMMNFGGGPTESSSEELNMFHSNEAGGRQPSYPQSSKKRFRTKFSRDQKDKMMEFAEKLGWRIQKQDEPEVQQFCAEVGVKRQVFKVWMHNSKQAMKKKQM